MLFRSVMERLVIMTESGQLKLTETQQAESRSVTISHGDLRAIGRPPADYVRVLPLAGAAELPPNHRPVTN